MKRPSQPLCCKIISKSNLLKEWNCPLLNLRKTKGSLLFIIKVKMMQNMLRDSLIIPLSLLKKLEWQELWLLKIFQRWSSRWKLKDFRLIKSHRMRIFISMKKFWRKKLRKLLKNNLGILFKSIKLLFLQIRIKKKNLNMLEFSFMLKI